MTVINMCCKWSLRCYPFFKPCHINFSFLTHTNIVVNLINVFKCFQVSKSNWILDKVLETA